jgi:hypothetical protein
MDVDGSVSGVDFVGILFGEVTGNWTAPPPEGCPPPPPSAAAAPAAPTSRSGQPAAVGAMLSPLPGGRTFVLELTIEDADGVLAMDLALDVAALGWRVIDARAAGIGAGHQLLGRRTDGSYRMAFVGVQPLAGSGTFARFVVEGPRDALDRLSSALRVEANEGQIPVVVVGGSAR